MQLRSNSSELTPLNHTENSESPKRTPGDYQKLSAISLQKIKETHKLPRNTPDVILNALSIFEGAHVSYIGRSK